MPGAHSLGGVMTHQAEALIVVDVQRAFVCGPGAIPGASRLTAAVDLLITRARDAGALVIHLQNDGAAGSVDEPGSPGWALVSEPRADEPVVRKHEDDGFRGTGLEALLRAREAGTVVVCGVQSEMCVAATARGVMSRGMTVLLPRDAHGTYPVPADGDAGVAVPAAHVARVAEWSLGDGVVVLDRADHVGFRSRSGGSPEGQG